MRVDFWFTWKLGLEQPAATQFQSHLNEFDAARTAEHVVL